MMKNKMKVVALVMAGAFLVVLPIGCGSDSEDPAKVRIENDFDNTTFERQPPWTICDASYGGAFWTDIGIGETSEPAEATPGLDHVLMVAAWEDPTCAPEHCLPLASKNEEETIAGQERTIVINVPNHQGPCPPEALGIEGIPQDLYDRILELWPDYGFLPYAQRRQNPQCQ